MRLNLGLAAAIAVALAGCASTTREAQVQTAISLTKEHFKNTATIKDDSLDTTATITTVNGLQEKRGLLGIVRDDNFLRAFIDKKTGRTTIQLYQVIYYQGSGWKFYQTVNYETPTEPESRPVMIISRDVDCSGSRYSGCTYTEHVGFDVDEKLLRTIAVGYQPGQPVGWKFKFNAKSGKDYNDGMLTAEVAGFLEAIDAYRASRGMAGAAPAPAASRVVSQTDNSIPTLSQKEKWVTTMATKNGCDGAIRVNFKNNDGIREVFEAICENKTIEFTCEFSGPVSEAMGGIPFVAVTGKSYQTQPACWR